MPVRWLDFLFLCRPILFFPGWTTQMAGFCAAADVVYLSHIAVYGLQPLCGPAELLLAMLYLACAMSSGSILNQIKDINGDQANSKLFILADGFVSIGSAYLQSAVLLLVAFGLAWLLNTASLVLLALAILIAGYAYNFKPFVFKNYPIRGMLANMAMGWSVFMMGWLVLRPPGVEALTASLPYLGFNTALYILTTLPDVEGDRRDGKITLAVRYGIPFCLWLSLLVLGGAFFSAWWLQDALILITSAATLPFLLAAVITRSVRRAILAIKFGLFLFALAICTKFPWFLVIIVVAYFGTRFYYRKRFGYDYPNFHGQ